MKFSKIPILVVFLFLDLNHLFAGSISIDQDRLPEEEINLNFPEKSENEDIILDILSVVEEDPFSDLIEAVATDESGEIPQDLSEMVEGIYADIIVPEDIPMNVLDFLTSVYMDHGYTESGSWVKPLKTWRYVEYKGILPDYTPGDFHIPAGGKVTSDYGSPRPGRHHHGVDLALKAGDSVRAALPGVVTGVGFDPAGYGNYVVVAHSGEWETLYGHLQSYLVNPGEKVKAGDIIGLGGSTGNSTGPHLHFETRFRGTPVNPASWITSHKLSELH